MSFTEYRSKSLKALWKKYNMDYVVRLHNFHFSSWRVDDICANNWKHNNPIHYCVSVLADYLVDELLVSRSE